MPEDELPASHHLEVKRTARYCLLGSPRAARELWFVLHGYGQLAPYFIRPFEVLNGGSRLIAAPEALSRFYLRGHDGRVGATWMTREERRHEIDDYLQYLDALYAHLHADTTYPDGTCLLGFSQGAATACRWAAAHPARFDRLVLWAGGVPPDVEPAAFQKMSLSIVVGTDDAYVSEERLDQERRRLDEAGLSYALIRYEGTHRIDRDVLQKVAAAG